MTTEEYRVLWNAITDAIEELEQLKEKLKAAQCHAEDIVIRSEEE